MLSLGNKAKADELFCETLHYTVLEPPVAGGAQTLQEVLNTGNEAISDMFLDEKYSLGTAAAPTAEFRKRVNGIGTDVVIRGKNSATGIIDDALIVKADGTLEARSAVIRSNNATADEVRIGNFTSATPVGNESVNIGEDCGGNGGLRGVNIGWQAGQSSGTRSVCIGDEAGNNNVGNRVVAIGQKAMEGGGSNDAICIGAESGRVLAGEDAIAIGHYAGETQLDDNTIVLNGSGVTLNTAGANRCYIDPIRQVNTTQNGQYILFRNPTSKEIYYDHLRYDYNQQFGQAGSSYNQNTAVEDVYVMKWNNTTTGYWSFNLVNVALIQAGTRFTIKNFTETTGQIVEIIPNGTQNIDGSNTPIYLNASTRSTAGGGGSSIEIMKLDSSNWVVLSCYNGTVNTTVSPPPGGP